MIFPSLRLSLLFHVSYVIMFFPLTSLTNYYFLFPEDLPIRSNISLGDVLVANVCRKGMQNSIGKITVLLIHPKREGLLLRKQNSVLMMCATEIGHGI